jgi:hypothetical protein
MEDQQLKLEITHNFSEEEIWVKKHDLALLGYLTDGKVGRFEEDGKFKAYKWDEIKDDFLSEGYQTITPMETDDGEMDCFQMTINRCRWEKFENRWLPFPFFNLRANGKSDFGPINWCRFKLIPDTTETASNIKKYNLLLAFDTRTTYEGEGFEEEDSQEMPIFINEDSKKFALCNNEFSLIDFCTKHTFKDFATDSTIEIDCEWVDELLLKCFHNCTKMWQHIYNNLMLCNYVGIAKKTLIMIIT